MHRHRLPELGAQLGLDAELWAPQQAHIAIAAALLVAPGLFASLADIAGRAPFSSSSIAFGTPRLAGAALSSGGGAAAAAGAGIGGGPTATAPPPKFLALSYGYLPLVWGATLAHYLKFLLSEGGRVLPVAAATFGWEESGLPEAVAHPAVVSFLQVGPRQGGGAVDTCGILA